MRRLLLRTGRPVLFVAALLMFSASAHAQVDTGTIVGTVKDESGAVLPGATVTITHEGQSFTLTTVTRQDGTYVFTPIRTGTYSIDVEFQGFKKGVRKGVNVGLQQQAMVDFALQPGGLSEELVVTADAPLLQTGSGTVGETLTGDFLQRAPVIRDYTVLARLAPGVVPPQPGARAPLMFAANGVRPAQNNYLLDGIDNNTSNVDFLSGVAYIVRPPVDAVDEIKILTSSFSAEYGRAGGAVFNATLKSGTSQLRGTAWEAYRNEKLNANDFFANRAGLKKGDYLSNQFGFTAGGPGIGTKMFWFADYEGTLVKQARTWVTTVPTVAQRSSGFTNFSDLITLQSGTLPTNDVFGRTFPRGTVFDPATTRQLQAGQVDPVTGLVATRTGFVRDPFPNNQIPAARINPNALRLMQLYPEANQPGLNNNYVVNRNNTEDTHSFDLRVDHNFSSNDRFFARYSFSDNHKVRPSPFDGDGDGGGFNEGDEKVRVNGFAASHTHMFSSTLINEARFGVSREHTNRLQPGGDDTSDLPGRYGILGIPQVAGNGGLPTMNISGLSMLGHAGWVVSERFSNTTQFSDNLTKVYKSHTFKGGYMYQDIFFGSTQPPYSRGQYDWNGSYTSIVNQADGSTGRVHMLLSQVASTVPGGVDNLGGLNAIRISPFGAVDAFKSYHGAYAQDSWRATPKLTLNYGLRWDYFSREQEREAEQANMVPGPPARYMIPAQWRSQAVSQSFVTNLAQDGIELLYTDEYGSGLGKMPKNNFAPRADAAYQLAQKHVVRAGYGLFYGAFENRGGNPSLGYNYPFQFTLLYQSPNDTAPNRLPDGSLVGLDVRNRVVLDPINVNANGLSMRGVEFDYKTPRYHNYNVMLQSEVIPNHSVEIGYVGTRGRNLETFTGMNNVMRLLPPGTNPQPHVQWPSFARGSLLVRTVGVSSYDALQTRFERRFHRGLAFRLTYTLSESKTNAGDSLSGGGVGGLRAPDVVGWNLENDIGLSGFHTKHALIFSGNADLPGKGPILGGWRTSWVLSVYSGQAQTIGCSITTGAGTGCYALVVGDPYAGTHDVNQFYNPDAFADPAVVTAIGQTDFGPLGGKRSQVTGPPLRQLNMALAKQFSVGGHRRLEVRTEVVNLTNTPAFNLPGSLNFRDARNFASITSMRNEPRQIQVGAKLYW